MGVEEAKLGCGLRVIYERSFSEVVYCGLVVRAGTRDEEDADLGMAHFVEHMTFKGTSRRKAYHISNRLEVVGGELNAYTTKQETVYHATVMKEDFGRAADLLCDMVFHSVYAPREIEREVEVICEEIESYEDSPSEKIFDDFEALIYPNQALGRDILGRVERLREYGRADALRFVRRYYVPENTVFFVYGNLRFEKVVRTLERLLPAGDFDLGFEKPALALARVNRIGEEKVVEKGTHQAHVMVGGGAFGGRDRRRFALKLLNNVLGVGMNSRLNRHLREREGLVYCIESYLNFYPDTGFWNVYYGCEAADAARCGRLVRGELRRLAEERLTPGQLAAAKKQLRGQIGIGKENGESYAQALGREFAHYGTHRDIKSLCEAIEAVSAEEVREVAATVFAPSSLITLIYK